MDNTVAALQNVIPFGIGSYSATEASRLLKTSALNIRRWMLGYAFKVSGNVHESPPLWQPQIPIASGHLELGFRDLIELRFVKAFIDAGVGLKAIRGCLSVARSVASDQRPFSTRRFRTDGRTIFLESLSEAGESELLDLKKRQYVLTKVIERTFRDLEIEQDVVARWRPYRGKQSIIIDPERSFGQPITSRYGVPTIALAEAVVAEGSVSSVSKLFEIPESVVRDAVAFERQLEAAA